MTFFGVQRLPFSWERKVAGVTETSLCTRCKEELPAIATLCLNEQIRRLTDHADVLKRETEGRYTEDGYELCCTLTVLKELAEPVPFTVSPPEKEPA